MVISLDGKYIYFAGGPILDVTNDSLVGWLGSGYGETANGTPALSPDGLHLYITDPANFSIPEPTPSGKIGIFETGTESYIGFIDVNSALASSITDRMVIMPDGKKAYVTDSIANIFVLDLETNTVVDVIRFRPRNIMVSSIAIAPK
jgi:YVTN family beta-propeller protein